MSTDKSNVIRVILKLHIFQVVPVIGYAKTEFKKCILQQIVGHVSSYSWPFAALEATTLILYR